MSLPRPNDPSTQTPVGEGYGVVARHAPSVTDLPGEPPRGVAKAMGRMGFPLVASLTLHGALIAALVSAALAHRPAGGVGQARSEVVINLPPAPPQPEQTPAPGAGDVIARPAPADAPLPQLQGL